SSRATLSGAPWLRRRRIIWSNSFEFKLKAADHAGRKVVNQRSDRATDKRENAIDKRDRDHYYQSDKDSSHSAHGLTVYLRRQARDGRAEDHEDESVDDSDQQSDYETQKSLNLGDG